MSIVNCKELFCKFSFIGKAYQEMFPKQLGTLEIKSIRNHLKYSVGWSRKNEILPVQKSIVSIDSTS